MLIHNYSQYIWINQFKFKIIKSDTATCISIMPVRCSYMWSRGQFKFTEDRVSEEYGEKYLIWTFWQYKGEQAWIKGSLTNLGIVWLCQPVASILIISIANRLFL